MISCAKTDDSKAGRQRELEANAAGLKAYATWHASHAINVAREACGGAGYLDENQLSIMRGDIDVFTTFEGDNTVLLQLVGKRLLRMQWRTGALFAPAVAAGMAVGRVGCLLTEPPGTATDVPWAVTVTSTADAAAWGVPLGTRLHPSFAYEIAFHLLALLAIWICRDRLADADDLFTLYITGYALFRFGVEAVRGNEVAWLGLTRPQLFLAATLPLLIWRSAVAVRRQPQGVEHGPAPAIG